MHKYNIATIDEAIVKLNKGTSGTEYIVDSRNCSSIKNKFKFKSITHAINTMKSLIKIYGEEFSGELRGFIAVGNEIKELNVSQDELSTCELILKQ